MNMLSKTLLLGLSLGMMTAVQAESFNQRGGELDFALTASPARSGSPVQPGGYNDQGDIAFSAKTTVCPLTGLASAKGFGQRGRLLTDVTAGSLSDSPWAGDGHTTRC